MPQSFRPYPEPGSDTQGTFRPLVLLRDTILNGPVQFLGIVPHFVLPFYAAYRFLKGAGMWTDEMTYVVDGLIIPLLQGLSVGGIITTGYMRYSSTGRLVARKRGDKSATSDEDTSQYRMEVALWSYIYLGFATILWSYFPAADGPGVKAAKRIIGKFNLGFDLGEPWHSKRK